MTGLILPLPVFLYMISAIYLLVRGWPVRAGLVMVATAVLPWPVWLLSIDGPLGPGAGMVLTLTMLMLLLASIPLGIGCIHAVVRRVAATRTRTDWGLQSMVAPQARKTHAPAAAPPPTLLP